MARRGSHKSRFLALGTAVSVLVTAGCAGPGPAPRDASRDSRGTTGVREPTSGNAYDFGEDWDRPSRAGTAATSPAADSAHWAILLATFSGQAHRERAEQELGLVRILAPELGDTARVHTTGRGSVVVYGRYHDPQTDAAQADLTRVKGVAAQGRALFPRAMLTRIAPDAADAAGKPNSLLTVRKIYPNVDPLYTLQVAVFSDFDSGTMTAEEVRRQAEAHCSQLRARGQEAYFHHDSAKGVSIVTAGLFDRSAIDPASGLLSGEVQKLMSQFPAHLVNGEPLREPIDRHRPELGTRVQQPRLVLVPMR